MKQVSYFHLLLPIPSAYYIAHYKENPLPKKAHRQSNYKADYDTEPDARVGDLEPVERGKSLFVRPRAVAG